MFTQCFDRSQVGVKSSAGSIPAASIHDDISRYFAISYEIMRCGLLSRHPVFAAATVNRARRRNSLLQSRIWRPSIGNIAYSCEGMEYQCRRDCSAFAAQAF